MGKLAKTSEFGWKIGVCLLFEMKIGNCFLRNQLMDGELVSWQSRDGNRHVR
jgi:hypothetical protein